MGNTFIDISGQTFNELTAIECLDKKKRLWKWKCSCGKECEARKNDVMNGKKKSCGHLCNRGGYNDIKIGDTFGEWTVISEMYVKASTGRQSVDCICSCGTERKAIALYDLTRGNTKSCGHSTTSRVDMENTRIGEWTIGEYLGNGEYECKCSCGKVKKLKGTYLRTGQSKSCGHATNAFQNLKDQVFGEWTVLEFTGDYTWKCRCSCGEIRNIGTYDLKTGKSTNCGHLRKEDLKDQRFGRLVVKEYVGDCKWKCQCDCGNETIVGASTLKLGGTKSCGCLMEYKEEMLKVKITEACINYIATHNQKPFTEEIAEVLKITSVTVRKYVDKYSLKEYINTKFGSLGEKEVYEFIKTITNSEIQTRNRQIINGLELDIYIPDKNIAIEYNGNFWHSEVKKEKYYHQQKSIECLNKGIRLIHIFEYEWNDLIKRAKIQNLLKEALSNIKETVSVCKIKSITENEAQEFCNKYHLQGYTISNKFIGVFDIDNELIGIATFNFKELTQLVWKPNITVKNGLEDIIRYTGLDEITVYVDLSKSDIKEYEQAGFKVVENTEPDYIWMYGEEIFTKEEADEDEIMYNLGYTKIHDCGNLKLVWKKE